jgi:hypothetical protein
MAMRMNAEKAKRVKSRLWMLLVVLAVFGMFALGYGMAVATAPAAQELPIQYISDFFLDINMDGYPDYVRNVEVILNPGVPLP